VKRIGAERYWQLRASQLEITLYEERKRSAHIARAGLGALGRMLGVLQAVDGLLEAYTVDSLGAETSLRQAAATLIRETGLALGMEGAPETWQIDMTGPDTATISVKEQAPNKQP